MFLIILFSFIPLACCFAVDTQEIGNCTKNEYGVDTCTLDETVVHFIDRYKVTGGKARYNYLFRGNMPKNSSNQFAYFELMQFMTAKAAQANITLPKTYYLVDISFLVFVEGSDLIIEQEFFQKFPQLGEVINFPLMGMCMSPVGIPDSVRAPMAAELNNWTWDKLPNMANLLRTYIETPRDIPTVIYIHCEAGKDRTGEISGSYYLQYLKWTFNETVQYNYNSPPPRQIAPDMLNGLQWFCYYLQYQMGYNLDCDL